MNVGKLNTALRFIKRDTEDYKIVAVMNDVKNALEQSIKEPNTPNTNNFRTLYSQLIAILEGSGVNLVSPTDNKLFDEIGASSRIGNGLEERLKKIFQDYNITPEKALSEYDAVIKEVQAFYNSVITLCKEFDNLELEYADLDINKPVIGVSFPLDSQKGNLKSLENIAHELGFAMKTFSEVTGETGEDPEIKFISSSDLGIFLISSMPIAYCFVKALDKISELYKRHLEIKLLKIELEKKNLPKNVISPIEEHLNQTLTIEITQISKKLVDEFYKQQDSGRKNELKVAMTESIKYLAKKIDNGVIFEAEVELEDEPEKPEGEEITPEYKTKLKQFKEMENMAKEINDKGSSILSLVNGNEPILFIPEKVDKKKSEQ